MAEVENRIALPIQPDRSATDYVEPGSVRTGDPLAPGADDGLARWDAVWGKSAADRVVARERVAGVAPPACALSDR